MIGRDQEEALIGAVLRDGTTFEKAHEIVKTADMFANWNYHQVWLACEHLYENHLCIDTVTCGDELERMGVNLQQGTVSGRMVLSQARENGEPVNVLSYSENVQDMATKRMLDNFWPKWAVWSKNGRRSKEIIKDVYTELGKIALYSSNEEYTVPISDAVAQAYEMTDRASRGEQVGVTTGFIDLNKMLGGFMDGNVYLVAARTGMGKTSLLLSMALSAAKSGKKVAIFSLEMSRSQVAQRLIAQWAEINLLDGIIRGKMADNEWPKYTQAIEDISALPIIINDLSSININEIRQAARKIDPDIVIVDYIQLADSGNKKTERRDLEVSAVSTGLKYLAGELNVPVLAAAQLSRKVEDRAGKRPELSDLRESGSLEQDAYCVLFIYKSDEPGSATEIIIAKHRNGPKGSIELIFRAPYAKFENATTRLFNPDREREDQR